VTSPLSDRVRDFLEDLRFATIATLDPDGAPRQATVWYRLDGDEIVINSAEGRRWPANLMRDPRIALTVNDGADGYRWVGLTGSVRATTDQSTAQADIAEMARRYHADDPDKAERLIRDRFRILGDIKTFTSAGRLTGAVLSALPLGMCVFMLMFAPNYFHKMWDLPAGRMILGIAFIGQFFGWLLIRKIVNIRV
jgi:PPOX class probable F420-dependent enzyme